MTKLTWEDIEKMTDRLAQTIKASGFRPDYIIGIANGGLIPLYFLAKKLDDVDNVLTVTASSYDKDRKKDLKILYLPQVDLIGKKVLLVDEIVETGDTLKTIVGIFKNDYKIGELKTVTLGVNLDKTDFVPDFYEIEGKGGWVVFPWEKEDFPEYFEELKTRLEEKKSKQ